MRPCLCWIVGAVLLAGCSGEYDRSFDARVAAPAYSSGGPVVLYDEAHENTHTVEAAYKPLADMLRSDGYTLRVLREPVSKGVLSGVGVLIVAGARGKNDANDAAAFTDDEVATIDAWVREGGSLLLVTDHWPYGTAAASLGARLGIALGQGMVEDHAHSEPGLGDSHLVFSRENGLLREHPILAGRSDAERIEKVLTFTGSSTSVPTGAVPFLALADTATERPPGPPRVEKSGGDVRVSMEYGDPASAAGRAQGIAFEVGRGRVVVLAEAGMLRAQRESHGNLVGMNHPGFDDRQLALNVLHWLSRAL